MIDLIGRTGRWLSFQSEGNYQRPMGQSRSTAFPQDSRDHQLWSHAIAFIDA